MSSSSVPLIHLLFRLVVWNVFWEGIDWMDGWFGEMDGGIKFSLYLIMWE